MTDFERLRNTFGSLGIPLIVNNYTFRHYDTIELDVTGYPDIFKINDDIFKVSEDGLACTVEVRFYFHRATQAFSHVGLVGG
jgi:hypothetical protein